MSNHDNSQLAGTWKSPYAGLSHEQTKDKSTEPLNLSSQRALHKGKHYAGPLLCLVLDHTFSNLRMCLFVKYSLHDLGWYRAKALPHIINNVYLRASHHGGQLKNSRVLLAFKCTLKERLPTLLTSICSILMNMQDSSQEILEENRIVFSMYRTWTGGPLE